MGCGAAYWGNICKQTPQYVAHKRRLKITFFLPLLSLTIFLCCLKSVLRGGRKVKVVDVQNQNGSQKRHVIYNKYLLNAVSKHSYFMRWGQAIINFVLILSKELCAHGRLFIFRRRRNYSPTVLPMPDLKSNAFAVRLLKKKHTKNVCGI